MVGWSIAFTSTVRVDEVAFGRAAATVVAAVAHAIADVDFTGAFVLTIDALRVVEFETFICEGPASINAAI